jgi:AcrR family transcriptional regulator
MRQRGSHRAGTFSAIKAAGIRLIYEHGYEAMTLRMLARDVGLESGSLYYHIKDKQDFLFRLLKEIIEGNLAGMEEKLRGIDDPEEGMRAFIRFFITNQWEKKQESFIVSSEVRSLTPQNYQALTALSRAYRDRVEEIIRKGVAAAKFRVRNVSVAAIAICDILGGPARWYYPKELLALDEIMEMITDMIFQMLGASQPVHKPARTPERADPPAANRPKVESTAPLITAPSSKAGPVGFPVARLWVR